MTVMRRMAAILFLLYCAVLAKGCVNNEVAIYEVKLKMLWTEDKLPNYRNPFGYTREWSPVFGQSHNRSYTLYHIGEAVRPAVQHLIHTGVIDDLMLKGEKEMAIYDQFSAPAVASGVGETNSMVVVDGEHSLVSLISRMIPMPDWFVGVDSVDLCIDSSWLDQITLDLEPLSSGNIKKDSSEDYPTSVEVVSKIGSRTYNHMAGYKSLREIPTIAKAEFTKKDVYSTEEINKLVRNDVIAKLKHKDHENSFSVRRMDYTENKKIRQAYFPESKVTNLEEDEAFDQTPKNNLEHLKELEEEPFGTPVPNQPENNVIIVTKAPEFKSSKDDDYEDSDEWMSMDEAVLAVAQGKKLGLNKHLPRHFKSRLHHAVNRPHRNYDAIF